MSTATSTADEGNPPTRAEVRRRQRQHLIIAATEAQLEDTGLQGTTLERVGERVGLSRASLYYYVDSRDDLLTLVLEDVFQQQRSEGDHIAGRDATPIQRLRAFVQGSTRVIVERPAGRLISSHLDLLATHERSAELMRDQDHYLRNIIADAVADETLKAVEPAAAAAVLFGTITTLPRGFNPDGRLELEELVDAALDLLLEGWLATTPTKDDE